jgi:hypothetical protein
VAELKHVNEHLWDTEDALRCHESANDFGPAFIELARTVYQANDLRAALKRQINELLKSPLVEEKSYATRRRSPVRAGSGGRRKRTSMAVATVTGHRANDGPADSARSLSHRIDQTEA